MGGSKKDIDHGEAAYQKAYDITREDLEPTDPARLGLVLNYSVFCHEIRKDPSRACRLTKKAVDEGQARTQEMNEEQYRDYVMIVQRLRENLDLWSSGSGSSAASVSGRTPHGSGKTSSKGGKSSKSSAKT